MIKAGTSAEPPLRRPFSILAVDPAAESFTLFIKAIGAGTRALCALEPGETAQCLGPLGRPFTPPGPGEEALLVAGGLRHRPVPALRRGAPAHGRPRPRLLRGPHGPTTCRSASRFEPLGVPLVAATEDGSLGATGRVTAPLVAYLDGTPGPVRLYACGPDAMLHAVARLAEERALPAEVSLDPWMGCGIGTCLGCVVLTQGADEARPKYRCACTEGPVFDAARGGLARRRSLARTRRRAQAGSGATA